MRHMTFEWLSKRKKNEGEIRGKHRIRCACAGETDLECGDAGRHENGSARRRPADCLSMNALLRAPFHPPRHTLTRLALRAPRSALAPARLPRHCTPWARHAADVASRGIAADPLPPPSTVPPVSWIDRAPAKLQPYLYLTRIDKPIGTLLLFYPCSTCVRSLGRGVCSCCCSMVDYDGVVRRQRAVHHTLDIH